MHEISAPVFDNTPVQGGRQGNPTEERGLEAARLKRDLDLIEQCLQACLQGTPDATGELYRRLKLNLITRQGSSSGNGIPCSPATFYRARIRFFGLLDRALREREMI